MADITPTVTYNPNGNANAVLVHWGPMATADVGLPFEGADWADRTVEISGDFNAAAVTLTMQGSNGGSVYASLTDPQGNAIAKTAAAIEALLENTRYVRPSASGGTLGAINVYLYARRQR